MEAGFIKKSILKVFSGFLLGTGFFLALMIFQKINQPRFADHATIINDDFSGYPDQAKVTESSYKLSDVEEKQQDGRVWIIGQITNTSKKSISGLQLQANLYKGEKFVDQYSEYISEALEPNKSRLFKISCGCKDNKPADHDSYKIVVIGGY
jgi:hypothetical protein